MPSIYQFIEKDIFCCQYGFNGYINRGSNEGQGKASQQNFVLWKQLILDKVCPLRDKVILLMNSLRSKTFYLFKTKVCAGTEAVNN